MAVESKIRAVHSFAKDSFVTRENGDKINYRNRWHIVKYVELFFG